MKRWAKIGAGAGASMAAALLLLCWHTGRFDDNLREVAPGGLYRSAQMSPEHLRSAIERYGIKSVVNLRGEAKQKDWHEREKKVCAGMNVRHTDIKMSAVRLPPPETVRLLLEAIDEGPYPMLVHCLSGSDRSGLASAVYEIVVLKRPVEEAASRQLTWHYGHVGIGGSAAMDEFFELYRKNAAGKDFRSWAADDYPKLYKDAVP